MLQAKKAENREKIGKTLQTIFHFYVFRVVAIFCPTQQGCFFLYKTIKYLFRRVY